MLLNCGVGEDLRVPWTSRTSNQSVLKEISPEYSLEGLMLKLKLQYFGYLMWRIDSLEKTLMLEKIEGRRRRGWQRMRWLDGNPIDTRWTWVWTSSGSWWWTREAWFAAVHGFTKSLTEHSDWTELNWESWGRSTAAERQVEGGEDKAMVWIVSPKNSWRLNCQYLRTGPYSEYRCCWCTWLIGDHYSAT